MSPCQSSYALVPSLPLICNTNFTHTETHKTSGAQTNQLGGLVGAADRYKSCQAILLSRTYITLNFILQFGSGPTPRCIVWVVCNGSELIFPEKSFSSLGQKKRQTDKEKTNQ